MPSATSDRHRILVLIKGLGRGGAEKLISESAALWDRDDFDYRVAYMLPWKDQLVADLEQQGIPVECLGWQSPPGARAIGRLRRLAREWRPDVVHSHLPAAGVMGRLTLTRPHHVYTEHNIVTSYRQPTRALNWATYRRNDTVIAVSHAVAESIERYPGPEPTVIPNGVSVTVDESDVVGVRDELAIGAIRPLVAHVGNIRPHKGHDTLIAATRLLVDAVPDVLVVSVGGEKHKGDLDRVRAAAARAGVSGHMRFMGSRSDALAFIAAADVVVNPADVEGLPVTLLEALALGRPVVATAVGGVPSVVHHEQSGLLVPPRDPVAMAEAIERALLSGEADEWGQQGFQLVRAEHGLDRMVRAYEAVYRSVLNA